MNLEVLVIRRETERALQVVLAERPYRIRWIPRAGVIGEWRAGERHVVLPLESWFARILSEEEWLAQMKRDQKESA